MKNLLVFALFATFFLCSCDTPSASTETPEEKAEEVVETKKDNSLLGTYTLADMIPMPGDKTLTKQDEEYISQSKERTIGNTILTFNEDGSFKRTFPHPSGDGTTKTWEGTYVLDQDKLTMNVNMNDKVNPLDFKVLAQDSDKLSLSSSFGQIDMNYVYKKQ